VDADALRHLLMGGGCRSGVAGVRQAFLASGAASLCVRG